MRQFIWLVVAVIIAAAIGVGTALALNHSSGSGSANAGHTGSAGSQPTTVPSVANTPTGLKSVDALNNPSAALPGTDWTTQTVTQAQAQSNAAGFSLDVPPGWKTKQGGLQTDFTGPGNLLVEVDLTQQSTNDMLAAATQVKKASLHRFPGYKEQNLQREPVRHTEGAFWKFTWTPSAGTQNTVDDIFFAHGTSAGIQDYAIYLRSPSSTFSGTSLPLFEKMLRTFKVVPNNALSSARHAQGPAPKRRAFRLVLLVAGLVPAVGLLVGPCAGRRTVAVMDVVQAPADLGGCVSPPVSAHARHLRPRQRLRSIEQLIVDAIAERAKKRIVRIIHQCHRKASA